MAERRNRRALVLLGVIGFLVVLQGCPFELQKEETENVAPNTFFDTAPPDTTFTNQAQFRWLGTDLDSDVVAYQYRLVETDSLYYFTGGQEGLVIRSLSPFGLPCDGRDGNPPGGNCSYDTSTQDPYLNDPQRGWVPRQTDRFESFAELEDGWYEFWARAIDARGAVDETPARTRFYVFFDDKAPAPVIRSTCGRLPQGTSFKTFTIDASDSSRSSVTPRKNLEYSVRLRATSQTTCTQHLADPFTEWKFFPDATTPIVIGNAPPTLYVDLFPPNCRWKFTVRVRDPAGNIGAVECEITAI